MAIEEDDVVEVRVEAEDEAISIFIAHAERELVDLKTFIIRGVSRLQRDRVRLQRERDRIQARLDAVMLEHCPDEMTAEQMATWAASQKPVDDKRAGELDAAARKE